VNLAFTADDKAALSGRAKLDNYWKFTVNTGAPRRHEHTGSGKWSRYRPSGSRHRPAGQTEIRIGVGVPETDNLGDVNLHVLHYW
jgi:hypothetical protein